MEQIHRILCWDEKNMAENTGLQVCMHHPQRRNIALLCDDEWEGV